MGNRKKCVSFNSLVKERIAIGKVVDKLITDYEGKVAKYGYDETAIEAVVDLKGEKAAIKEKLRPYRHARRNCDH
jgi:hypothetical protein